MTRPSSLADLATIFDSQSISGTRNRIINGDMRIDQRNNGASFSSGVGQVTYGLDRFYVFSTGAAVTGQRVNPSLTGFPSALRITGASGVTYTEVGQRIESANINDLIGSTVTVSFWAAASVATSLSVYSNFANSQDNFLNTTGIASSTITINSTLTRYSFSFALPSQAANGIQVGVFFPAGLTSGSSTFTLTGVQLEVGSVATPFERRQFGQELQLCQRYYQKSYEQSVVPGTSTRTGLIMAFAASGAANYGGGFNLKQTMRAAPSISYWDGVGNVSRVSYYATAWNDNNNWLTLLNVSSDSVVTVASVQVTASVLIHYAASAEL